MKIRVKDVEQHNEECRDCQYRSKCCAGCRAFASIQHPDDYLSVDSVSCKILKEHWDEKLYAVADQYFKRKTWDITE
ncbi:MAG: hypothetical protein Q4E53_14590 [Eubacteriales bacterium]|nr:hypothetical protein [Eubacteriales bacterium]